MNRIDLLKKNYQRLCEYSWDRNVAGAQRIWLAVYDKEDERKLRLRLGLFEEATHHSGHKWIVIDLTDVFVDWICSPDNASFAESYFESPELLDEAVLADMKKVVVSRIRSALVALPLKVQAGRKAGTLGIPSQICRAALQGTFNCTLPKRDPLFESHTLQLDPTSVMSQTIA